VLIASILMLLVGPAASASGDARVRFVQAIPGFGQATLQATEGGISQRIGRGVGFGEVGRYADVPAGEVTFELRAPGTRAGVEQQLRNHARYTVVAMRKGGASLTVLRDGRAEGGTSRLRVMHAAPELGGVDVRLGDRGVADALGSGDVTRYTAVEPGAYALSVVNPQDGSTIAARGAVTLTAGTSSTAFVIGTGGEPVQAIVAADRMAAPRGAPATGLGGLADEDPEVLLALLAGLLAALAGAGLYVAPTARARRGGKGSDPDPERRHGPGGYGGV
jgi:hypothetical protein